MMAQFPSVQKEKKRKAEQHHHKPPTPSERIEEKPTEELGIVISELLRAERANVSGALYVLTEEPDIAFLNLLYARRAQKSYRVSKTFKFLGMADGTIERSCYSPLTML